MEKYQVSDSELVSLYTQGSEKAFEKLVQRHKSKIYTTIYLIVKDQYVAEDLMQDSFVKAVDTIKQYVVEKFPMLEGAVNNVFGGDN